MMHRCREVQSSRPSCKEGGGHFCPNRMEMQANRARTHSFEEARRYVVGSRGANSVSLWCRCYSPASTTRTWSMKYTLWFHCRCCAWIRRCWIYFNGGVESTRWRCSFSWRVEALHVTALWSLLAVVFSLSMQARLTNMTDDYRGWRMTHKQHALVDVNQVLFSQWPFLTSTRVAQIATWHYAGKIHKFPT